MTKYLKNHQAIWSHCSRSIAKNKSKHLKESTAFYLKKTTYDHKKLSKAMGILCLLKSTLVNHH